MVYLGSFLGEVNSIVIKISALIVLIILVLLIRKFQGLFGFDRGPGERNPFGAIANKEKKLNRLQNKFFSRTIRELRKERRRIPYEMHESQGAKELANIKRSHIFHMQSLIDRWRETKSLEQRNNVVGEIHNSVGVVEAILKKQFNEYKLWMRASHFAVKQVLKAKKNLRKMLKITRKEENIVKKDASEKAKGFLSEKEKEESMERRETKVGSMLWKEKEQILKDLNKYKKILATQKKTFKKIDRELTEYLRILHRKKSLKSVDYETEAHLSECIGRIYKLLIDKDGLVAKANEEIALLNRIGEEENKDWGLSSITLRLLYGERKLKGSAEAHEFAHA